jgi:DNA polymerase-3 subunit gamma/tau
VSVPEAWRDTVKGQLKPLVRALYSAGDFGGRSGDAWLFEVPNEAHGDKCRQHQADVEAALAAVVGAPVTIEIVSTGGRGGTSEARSATSKPAPEPPGNPEPKPAPESDAPRESAIDRAARAAAAAPDPEPQIAPVVELPSDDEIDLTELTDAPPESVQSPVDRLAEAFPGSELMNDD